MSPFGVIDFVDNQCLSSAAAGGLAHAAGVVGGPPAYLDAHGIRYVPAASLEGGMDSPEAAPQLVPMGRSAAADPAPVSQGELNSRVDSRIRRFMAGKGDLREMREDINRTLLRSDCEDRSRRIEDLRDRIRSARYGDDRGARYADDMGVRSAGYADEDREAGAAADLRALRRQMEEEAAGLSSRARTSQPLAARGASARGPLRRAEAIDF